MSNMSSALTRLLKAHEAYVYMGAQPPESRDDITREYHGALKVVKVMLEAARQPGKLRTCATCKHWTPNGGVDWPDCTKRLGNCKGKPDDYAEARVDDDSGLRTYFAPPETFYCSGWEA